MKNIFNVYLLLLVILLFSTTLYSQENYYWNIQYGTRSTLLGGAVIGSVSDLSATYYNPGAIALFQNVKFILSARVYQFDNYTIKDGAAEGLDLGFSTLTPSPSFVAFDFDFNFLSNDKLALSILTRQSADFEFTTRLIDSLNVINSSPGKESFAGGFEASKKFNDVWGGATYSTKFGKMIGFGFTWYLAYISHRASTETILQALQSNGDIASFTDINNYRFNNLRTLWKAGIGINLNPVTLGFTITTPSVNIAGTGSAGTHRFLTGVDSTIFESNFQDDVKSQYKNPLSIGFGGAYRLEKFIFHFSGEWFNSIESYNVIDTEPYTAQGSGKTLETDLTHEAKSITNFGFGIDYLLNDEVILSGGFITDLTAKVSDTKTNLSQVSTWNNYHISAGSSFPIGKSEVTLGVTFTFGSAPFKNKIDITPDPNDETELRENEIVFNRIKILFGFEL